MSLHFGGAEFESCQKVTSVLELPIWSLSRTLGILSEVFLVVFSYSLQAGAGFMHQTVKTMSVQVFVVF